MGGNQYIIMQVIVDWGQVQEQVQIEIGLDVLNVGNMIILQGNVQLDKQIEKYNSYSNCSIWTKTK